MCSLVISFMPMVYNNLTKSCMIPQAFPDLDIDGTPVSESPVAEAPNSHGAVSITSKDQNRHLYAVQFVSKVPSGLTRQILHNPRVQIFESPVKIIIDDNLVIFTLGFTVLNLILGLSQSFLDGILTIGASAS
jgi:hypothetical protein